MKQVLTKQNGNGNGYCLVFPTEKHKNKDIWLQIFEYIYLKKNKIEQNFN